MAEYDKNRDPIRLEPHFCKHMLALTAEDLRAKSDIAAELAARDQELERLRAELAQAKADRDAYKRDLDAELRGIQNLRRLYGARDDEAFPNFMERLVRSGEQREAAALALLRRIGSVLRGAEHEDQGQAYDAALAMTEQERIDALEAGK